MTGTKTPFIEVYTMRSYMEVEGVPIKFLPKDFDKTVFYDTDTHPEVWITIPVDSDLEKYFFTKGKGHIKPKGNFYYCEVLDFEDHDPDISSLFIHSRGYLTRYGVIHDVVTDYSAGKYSISLKIKMTPVGKYP